MDREPDETIELGSLTISHGDEPDACVIWLHGLGADGRDFESIVPQLMLPASLSIRFVFPDAPMQPVTINGGMTMRAWYDIYHEISEDAEQDEDGIQASAKIISLLAEQQVQTGIDSKRIVLAGFSQGGAIALYAALTARQPLAGAMALSSYLPLAHHFDESTAVDHLGAIFMAHGDYDTVVPKKFAELSRTKLQECGVDPEWHNYPMEHSLCEEEIVDIRNWLVKVLG